MQAPSGPPSPDHLNGQHRADAPSKAHRTAGTSIPMVPDTEAHLTSAQKQSATGSRKARAIVVGAVVLGSCALVGAGISAAMIVRNARMAVTPFGGSIDSGEDLRAAGDASANKDSGTTTLAALNSPVPIAADDPANGDGDALVTWVVFSDLDSDACKKLDRVAERLRQKYSASDLRIVWKDDPVVSNRQSQRAAEIGRAVFTVGGYNYFRAYKNSVFQHQPLGGVYLLDLVDEEVNLSRSTISTIADSRATKKRIMESVTLGNQLKVRVLPTSYINGVTITGYQSADKVQATIETQLAAARSIASAGTPRERVYLELSKSNFVPIIDEVEEPKTAATTLSRVVREVPIADSPARGPQDALVTIVEFGDFQCPFCKRIETTMEALRRANAADVRVVWKDHPMSMHKEAAAAANFARELRKQKGDVGFWLVHDRLFTTTAAFGNPTFLALGAELKGDPLNISNALLLTRYEEGIKRDQDLAAALNVTGTPTFFFNGRKLDGAQAPAVFATALTEEIAAARAVLAKGVPKAQLYARLTARGFAE
jgi:protein-disulfide isomerase